MFGYIDSNGILRPMSVEDFIPQRAVVSTPASKKTKAVGQEKENLGEGGGKKRLLQGYQRIPALEEGTIRYAFQIMSTPAKTLKLGDSLAVAIQFFNDKGITWAPVVQEKRTLGLLSELDLLRWLREDKGAEVVLDTTPIEAVMRIDVITCSLHEEIRNIAKLFGNKNIEVLPVLNDGGELVGIITKGDLIEQLMKMNNFERRG